MQVSSDLRDIDKISKKFWTLLGVGILTIAIAISAIAVPAATEGQKRSGAPPWLGLFGTAIRPDGAMFIVGSKALLLVSTDHGKSWTQTTLKERAGDQLFQDRDLYSIRFTPDGKLGLIVGENGTIMRSADGGGTWTAQTSGTPKNLLKVFLLDDQTAVAVGADGTIVRTTDGGAHWQIIKCPKLITLFDVTFTDKNTGWAVGEFATVLNSTDGGQTWKVVSGGNTNDFTIGPYFTVNFTDAQNGIAGGLAGELATTYDGGKTWKPAKLPDQVGAYAVVVDAANKKVWAGGTGGRAFYQPIGGQWQEAPRATFNDLSDIALSGNEGVMVGLNGTILLTDNAGEQWQAVQ